MGLAIRGLCPLIQVFDMPRTLRFYRDVLGFAEVEKSAHRDDAGWAWLRHGFSLAVETWRVRTLTWWPRASRRSRRRSRRTG